MAHGLQGITNRQSALLLGQTTYLGKPCWRGHDGLREVTNRSCVHCARERQRKGYVPPAKQGVLSESLIGAPASSNKRSEEVATSRPEALKRGLIFYHGRPCKYGHGTKRYVSRRACVQCDRNYWTSVPAEIRNERSRRCYNKHREKNLARAREYAKNNPLWLRKVVGERRSREMNAGSLDVEVMKKLLIAQNFACAYCGISENLQLDHKIPLTRGGSNAPCNLQWLCGHHNASKNNMTDDEYRLARGISFNQMWSAPQGVC